MRTTVAIPAAWALSALIAGCGSRVSGRFYHNNGGVVQVEFRSSGKAVVSDGPSVRLCSYAESGKSVNLICNDGMTDVMMQDDGALVGPPAGSMTRLTPVKN